MGSPYSGYVSIPMKIHHVPLNRRSRALQADAISELSVDFCFWQMGHAVAEADLLALVFGSSCCFHPCPCVYPINPHMVPAPG